MELIIADPEGKELGYLATKLDNLEADMDVGGTNDYVLNVSLSEWPMDLYGYGYRIYIPDTEYGGRIQGMQVSESTDSLTLSGDLWRGMLAKKIIEPPAGQDYRSVSGEAHAILLSLTSGLFGDLFVVPDASSGIQINSYSFDRYTDLLTGLSKMLATADARLNIAYRRGDDGCTGYVELSAVPVVNYSEDESYSEDSDVWFMTQDVRNGINHLICLGKGDLKDRQVLHLYVQKDGSIGDQKYYTGLDERTSVYDFSNAATIEELRTGGIGRLRELQDYRKFDMQVDQSPAEIGDIVGGREFTTGFLIQQPVIQKIVRIVNAEVSIECKVRGSDAANGKIKNVPVKKGEK